MMRDSIKNLFEITSPRFGGPIAYYISINIDVSLIEFGKC
jgi:hypothetical protein